jgi:hypothetical protein
MVPRDRRAPGGLSVIPEDARDHRHEAMGGHRLLQVPDDLAPDSPAYVLVERKGRHEHDGWRVIEGVENGEAVSAGHFEVEEHDTDVQVPEQIEGHVAVLSDFDAESRHP